MGVQVNSGNLRLHLLGKFEEVFDQSNDLLDSRRRVLRMAHILFRIKNMGYDLLALPVLEEEYKLLFIEAQGICIHDSVLLEYLEEFISGE